MRPAPRGEAGGPETAADVLGRNRADARLWELAQAHVPDAGLLVGREIRG